MENSRFRDQEILVGYITPIKDDVVSNEEDSGSEKEDSEEEEGDDPDLFYFNELSSEGEIIKQSTLRRSEVNFTESDGTTKRVLGRFPLSDPWWEVTCSVTQDSRGKLVMPGYPSYRLRSDIDNSVVSLFMKACGMSSDFVSQFIEWLPRERKVNLTNLPEALHEFEKAARIHKAVPGQMNTLVINSDAGYAVRAAHLFPQVMKHLPTLLPHHFAQLLQKGGRSKDKTPLGAKANEEAKRKTQEKKMIKLHKLEEIITRDVWKLGFHRIVYRETGFIKGEAKQNAFRTCGLFERIPPLQCSALKLYWKLKKETDRDGSTYKTMADLAMGNEDTADKALEFLKEQNIMVITRQRVALWEHHHYETGIAKSLGHLLWVTPWHIKIDVEAMLRDAFGEAGKLDDDQKRAAQMICDNPVTVISGVAGCGKTSVVSLVFKEAIHQEDGKPLPSEETVKVLLTAPTGRAASLLNKRTKLPAYTLHQVIWNFMNAEKDVDGKPIKWKFSPVQALVVDEGSLVSVQILHTILEMLIKHASLKKFVLLGDLRQLPSIKPGNTMHDLFHSAKVFKWAVEMRTNHRAESELIVKNAAKISEMGKSRRFRSLDFDAIVKAPDVSSLSTLLTDDSSFIHILLPSEETDDDLVEAIRNLLASAPGLKDVRTSQFITYTRKGCEMINDLCCKHYSDHITRDDRKRFVFEPRDKVCCTKSGYVIDREKEKESERSCDDDGCDTTKKREVKERLCNGQIFFITKDVTEIDVRTRKKRRYLELEDYDESRVTVRFRDLRTSCRMRHAWCRTIHTFQGSEAETIVYVVGKSSHQNWRYVYTAVTRGQKRVYIISTEDQLRKAMEQRDHKRQTQLEGLVKQEVNQRKGMEGEKATKAPHTPHGGGPTPGPGTGPSPGSGPGLSTPRTSEVPTQPWTNRQFQPRNLWKKDVECDTSPTEKTDPFHNRANSSCAEDHGNSVNTTTQTGVFSHVDLPEKVLQAERESRGSDRHKRPVTPTTSQQSPQPKQPRNASEYVHKDDPATGAAESMEVDVRSLDSTSTPSQNPRTPSAFEVLMKRNWLPPPSVGTSSAQKKVRNAVLELLKKRGIGWQADSTQAKVVVDTLSKVLFSLDTHHEELKEQGANIPLVFSSFQGFHPWKKNKKSKPKLSKSDLDSHDTDLSKVIDILSKNAQANSFKSDVEKLQTALSICNPLD